MHQVFFGRWSDGLVRAVCTCGWTMDGEQDDVAARAACHDLDAVDAATEPEEAAS